MACQIYYDRELVLNPTFKMCYVTIPAYGVSDTRHTSSILYINIFLCYLTLLF